MALELAGRRVLVAGGRATGVAVVELLLELGARPEVMDQTFSDPAAGADFRGRGIPLHTADDFVGDDGAVRAPDGIDLIVVSPGFRPDTPLLVAAADAGVPVWGDVELAWRADRDGLFGAPRTWLVVTGTNGKTTTTGMIESIVSAAGLSGLACGNIGLTVADALRAEPRADVLCVEMSSFQLHWAPSVRPRAGVVLNVADDHLDWHGSLEAYAAAKAQALLGDVAVVGVDDAGAARLPVGDGTRRTEFTLSVPTAGQLGIVDGDLVDRAFAEPSTVGRTLIPAAEVRPGGPSGLSDALAAAALARAIDIAPEAVARGLRDYQPAAHRGQVVATIGDVVFVDDSKATNPHAAQAAVVAHERAVLIAGGLLKGAPVDDLVVAVAPRLAGVVAIGTDRQIILDAFARHAPEVPAVTVFTRDDGSVMTQRTGETARSVAPAGTADCATGQVVMGRAVDAAWQLAQADTVGVDAVLLAPAAASLDMFAAYTQRGDAFAAAAVALADSAAIR
ncbi:UDP-N-acetylmuramoyl-L-alanine--D-glutamate ligase [Gordonia phthalatica]|uniref:UDP-N-acetylmuramoylalanine--D-glutamate ligase n=1 Tax=Gordonia phthalatica TaxID=1136941 RepID=A0A0N9N436_9ACTN|nr:UDP-N-acetylmuramoyl-L-alanine--D-glutamate ligase [Gordonia phthalatica]ALG85148.1 UDP-N-acetylmuramoyl-L-alanyl-D-glutamate synthetase [Gordonia phthalatica]